MLYVFFARDSSIQVIEPISYFLHQMFKIVYLSSFMLHLRSLCTGRCLCITKPSRYPCWRVTVRFFSQLQRRGGCHQITHRAYVYIKLVWTNILNMRAQGPGSPRARVPKRQQGLWVSKGPWSPKVPTCDPMGTHPGIPRAPTLGSHGHAPWYPMGPPQDPRAPFYIISFECFMYIVSNKSL